MAGETLITVCGNLVAPPELRFTPSGAAVANFTIASTPRNFDRQSGEWKDGDTLFMRCALWKKPAENLAESDLQKGARVLVSGRLKQRSFEVDGQKRTVVELEVDEFGVSVKSATVKVTKVSAGSEGGGRSAPAESDPWTSSADSDQAPF